jgi:hypothetical protein
MTIETCPDCGGKVRSYHGPGITRRVCADKCNGWKVLELIPHGVAVKKKCCYECGIELTPENISFEMADLYVCKSCSGDEKAKYEDAWQDIKNSLSEVPKKPLKRF